MKIYVGNLAYKVKEEDLTEVFSNYGEVSSVKIIRDRLTKRSKGYAFVTLPDVAAIKAIADLNGREFMERNMVVKEGKNND